MSLQVLNINRQAFGQAGLLAIQHLLERTPSIQFLGLKHLSFDGGSRPFFQALIHSSTTSKVRLDHCSFTGPASADLFSQMIQTKPNLQLLSIESCTILPRSKCLLRDSLSAVLLRPNSSLRTLELRQDGLNTFFPGPTFGALLSAVGRSSLERFSIGNIYSEAKFQFLMSSLPAMKIRDLEIHLVRHQLRDGGVRKRAILRAAKRNFRLRSLKASFERQCFLHRG